MASIQVSEEQYLRVIAFRGLCLEVADKMKPLLDTRVPGVTGTMEGYHRVLQRQAKQIATLPDMPLSDPPAISVLDLKQAHKLLGSAFNTAGLLDAARHMGVPGTETDFWSPMRAAAQGLLDLPGKPWANKP
jgi:hypothetical protein